MITIILLIKKIVLIIWFWSYRISFKKKYGLTAKIKDALPPLPIYNESKSFITITVDTKDVKEFDILEKIRYLRNEDKQRGEITYVLKVFPPQLFFMLLYYPFVSIEEIKDSDLVSLYKTKNEELRISNNLSAYFKSFDTEKALYVVTRYYYHVKHNFNIISVKVPKGLTEEQWINILSKIEMYLDYFYNGYKNVLEKNHYMRVLPDLLNGRNHLITYEKYLL